MSGKFDGDRAERLFDVSGQAVVVTGAGSGIGRAMAEVMAANGARVMLADIDPAVEKVASELRDGGAEVDARVTDIADTDSVDALFAAAVSRFGRVDVTFANAGINRGMSVRDYRGSIQRFRREDWDAVINTNLTGAFTTLAASARVMVPAGSGSIIVTASTASLRAEPMVGYAYVASKAAVVNLVRQASIELAPSGVRVNAIAPGPIVTNIGKGRPKPPDFVERWLETIPLGRRGETQDLKGIGLLLASQASSFVTGAVWTIDGGASALTQGWMRDVAPLPGAAGDENWNNADPGGADDRPRP
jgi:NAD(P)-dependent dehydrogenase (short-subunit alcohol dehydrogenase family)